MALVLLVPFGLFCEDLLPLFPGILVPGSLGIIGVCSGRLCCFTSFNSNAGPMMCIPLILRFIPLFEVGTPSMKQLLLWRCEWELC